MAFLARDGWGSGISRLEFAGDVGASVSREAHERFLAHSGLFSVGEGGGGSRLNPGNPWEHRIRAGRSVRLRASGGFD